MPKAKAIPKRRPQPARKVARKAAPSRLHTTPRKPPQKARPAMSTTAAAPAEKSGYNANSDTENRKTKKGGGGDYPKGDIEKGRIDPEEQTQGQVADIKAARDRRAYLIDQAEKNEAANDELNAIQVEQNKRVQLAQNLLQDPDHMRDESMETAVNALKAHDPETRKKTAAAVAKRNEQLAKDKAKDKEK